MTIPKGYIPKFNYNRETGDLERNDWWGQGTQFAFPWGEPIRTIPPFDSVIKKANHYGREDLIKILGCVLMNNSCGYGISIDDIINEHSHQFILQWLEDENQLRLPGVD